uniref:Uncharacterized protein n=1 Tax=Physcomitrium patens TaxID=3218 RepID=A0A2K1KP22_PHYPA|nr:hypothetical protein PHYPA_006425 [Physcomitrium patens]
MNTLDIAFEYVNLKGERKKVYVPSKVFIMPNFFLITDSILLL